MRIDEAQISRLASSIVSTLVKQGNVQPKVPEKQIADRIVQLLVDDLRAEDALEREAEAMAEKLGRQTAGMDHRKLVLGIKARLAKERGFNL